MQYNLGLDVCVLLECDEDSYVQLPTILYSDDGTELPLLSVTDSCDDDDDDDDMPKNVAMCLEHVPAKIHKGRH